MNGIKIVVGDITKLEVDAIVNEAVAEIKAATRVSFFITNAF